MPNKIKIIDQVENDKGWEFTVAVDSYEYQVTVPKDYYLRLTTGKILPEILVKESFKFMLRREPAGSILPEFELPIIGRYFPEYEQTVIQKLK